jgi:hypothetical protein
MKPILLNLTTPTQAQTELTKIGVHPVGAQIMSLKAIHQLVKIENIDPKTANIAKQEMLARGGDIAVSASVGEFSPEKTHIIIMGTLAQYIRLIRKLRRQNYCGCQALARELKELLFKDYDIETAPVY